jgi:hypothetical protein
VNHDDDPNIDEQRIRDLIGALRKRYGPAVEERESGDLVISSVPVPEHATDY